MKTELTTFPLEQSLETRQQPCRYVRWLACVGVILFTGPIWGLIGAIIGMILSFITIPEGGSVAPAIISKYVSFALTTTTIGMIVGLLGGTIILTVVFFSNFRAKWFQSWSFSLAIACCFAAFPLGLFIGLPISTLFTIKRREFKE